MDGTWGGAAWNEIEWNGPAGNITVTIPAPSQVICMQADAEWEIEITAEIPEC